MQKFQSTCISKLSKHCSLLVLSLFACTALAELQPLTDEKLSDIDGQAGLGFYLDDFSINTVADPNNGGVNPGGIIEITSDGGLSLAISDLTLTSPDGSSGLTLGSPDDSFYVVAPKLSRLDASGNITDINTLMLVTPSRDITTTQPGRLAFTINQYFEGNTEILDANNQSQATPVFVDASTRGAFADSAFGYNNPSRFVLNNFILNEFNGGFEPDNVTTIDENRRTHIVAWGNNNEIKLAGRVTFQTDFHWGAGFSDLGPNGYNQADFAIDGRKTELTKVGYATPVDDPTGPGFTPISSGISIQNLSVDLAIGRLSYQPLTFSLASADGDLTIELAQIAGNPDLTVSIDDPSNAVAKEFYADPLSKSNIKWDGLSIATTVDGGGNPGLDPVSIGGGEIRGLRIHYLNITTCADATSVATCN